MESKVYEIVKQGFFGYFHYQALKGGPYVTDLASFLMHIKII